MILQLDLMLLFFFVLVLVLLVQYAHEVFAHKVWLLGRPVIALAVLKEAEEKSVNSHGIHIKEGAGDEESANGDDDDRGEVVIHLRKVWPETRHLTTEDEEGSHSYASHHHHFADKQQEVCHLVQYNHPHYVTHDEREGVLGRYTEVLPVDGTVHIGIPVDELEELFKAPETAAATTKQCPYDLAVCLLFHLVVNILQDDSDHANNGNDEGPEGQRPCVVPQGASQAHGESEGGYLGFIKHPVPGGKSSCQYHFPKGRHKEHGPEESKEVVCMEPRHFGIFHIVKELAGGARAQGCIKGIHGAGVILLICCAVTSTISLAHNAVVCLPCRGKENRHHTEQSQEDELQDVRHEREEQR